MDQELVAAIRKTLEAKPTDELRRTYEARDQNVWSPEAFEAMMQLLAERGETGLPPPDPRGDDDARMGTLSLKMALVGLFLPLGCVIADVVVVAGSNPNPGGRSGPPESMIKIGLAILAACIVLCVVLEVAAIRYGIAGRRTPAGRAGIWIAALVLVPALAMGGFMLAIFLAVLLQ